MSASSGFGYPYRITISFYETRPASHQLTRRDEPQPASTSLCQRSSGRRGYPTPSRSAGSAGEGPAGGMGSDRYAVPVHPAAAITHPCVGPRAG
jgi:hypothetical protein